MARRWDTDLFILAFDHRGSFQKDLYGVTGEPNAQQKAAIIDVKHLIFEAMVRACENGLDVGQAGVLVDEEYGSTIPEEAKARGLVLAMPVEKSGQDEFDFEYGDDFGEHIEKFDPDFAKVLVRYNAEGDQAVNEVQRKRLKRLSDWLVEHNRRLLFELLVPATPEQLAGVDGDSNRYDLELRPALMKEAIREFQKAGVEPAIWKIEGLDKHQDNLMIAEQARADGRDHVTCIVLGRDAPDDKLDLWLREAATAEDFIGFAIGRSIWLKTLNDFVQCRLGRDEAIDQIAAKYSQFITVWRTAKD